MNRLTMNIFVLLTLSAANGFAAERPVTGNAVGDLVIGQRPPNLEANRLVFRRWEHDENNKRYELMRVRVQGHEVDAEVHDRLIWRIWIDKPGLKTSDGVGVGDGVNQLLKKISIVPEIGPGPSLVFISSHPCGISYLTDAKLPEELPERVSRAFVAGMRIPVHVSKILIFGCGNK